MTENSQDILIGKYAYRHIAYNITSTEEGFYVGGSSIVELSGPYHNEAVAHAAAKKLIDSVLAPPEPLDWAELWWTWVLFGLLLLIGIELWRKFYGS